MNKDRVLTALIVADVLLCFATIGAELMFHWTLPASLQEYALSQMFWRGGLWSLVLFGAWSASVLCAVVAWIGLLNYWWFARPLYVASWTFWVLMLMISGPSVMTSIGAVVTTLEAITGGAILGLVYFSDLARSFERRPAAAPSTI